MAGTPLDGPIAQIELNSAESTPTTTKKTTPNGLTASSMTETTSVCLNDFTLLKVLGKGSYGKVYQVRARRGPCAGRLFALKSMRKDSFVTNRLEMRHTRHERDVLANVAKHPFLVQLAFAFETKTRAYLVQEFLKGGELFTRLQVERFFLEDEARFYLSEIVLAIAFLHDKDVIYRDLKSENVMLDAQGHIKLIDFGLCKPSMDDETVTYTFCGTAEYMAPEVVSRRGHGKAADWWTFGAFTFDILTGHSPFHHYGNNKEAIKNKILQCKISYPKILTPNAIDLIRRLLKKEIERRLGSGPTAAEEIKNHRFFGCVDWQKVLAKSYPPPYVPELKSDDDVSCFDTRFTSISPRESLCVCSSSSDTSSTGSSDGDDDPFGTMFHNFAFVAPDRRRRRGGCQ